ncbi:MAG: Dihydrolipoyl dehydrogenase [Candidatus Izimaplasma bacterium HR2]|nr:MAG: Dihydrolipoyl dehydrogenase [Candidatus Izimaplasma bacterium HR2]
MKDLVIIGAGPGGFDTAIHAKEHGLDVTLIERHKVGGTCLNVGCIPTKTLYHNAKTIKNMKELDVFGVEVKDFKVNYETIKTRKETIVDNQINNILTSIKKLGIELIEGEASIIAPNKVEVNGEIIEAKNIIIATGSVSRRIPFPGDDFDIVHDSEDILSLETFPKKMIVIGAGVIGCEMATIFNHFDCEVTLVEYLDEILPPLDKDIKKRARNLYKRSGIKIYTKSVLKEVIKKDGKYFALVESKGKMLELETDYVLLATGRAPSFGNLDLDKLGIEYTNSGIKVNDNFETNVKSIYAIGDVTGILMLAHKATYDGYKVVSKILEKDMAINFNQVPSVVFSFPEIATVGVTEQELDGKEYRTNKYLFKTNAKAECLNETDGFIKMIVDGNDILVGVHIIGAHASDLIHEVTAIMYKKINIYEYQNIIHAHPTISEVVGECIKKF